MIARTVAGSIAVVLACAVAGCKAGEDGPLQLPDASFDVAIDVTIPEASIDSEPVGDGGKDAPAEASDAGDADASADADASDDADAADDADADASDDADAADAAADADAAPDVHTPPVSQTVGAAAVAASGKYRMVFALGAPATGAGAASPQYRLVGPLQGANGH